MSTILAGAAVGKFLKDNWKWIAIVGVLALCLLLAYCLGGAGERESQLEREVDTQQEVGEAKDKASDLRVEDKARIVRQQEELKNALKDAKSDDDRRRRNGCAILRQQGADISRYPRCAGS